MTTALRLLVARMVPEGSTSACVSSRNPWRVRLGIDPPRRIAGRASPTRYKQLHYAWFFGLSVTAPGPPSFLGVFAVLGGMVALLIAWFWLLQVQASDNDTLVVTVDRDLRRLDTSDARRRANIQSRCLHLRRAGRNGEPSHQSVCLRSGCDGNRHGIHDARRPDLVAEPLALRATVFCGSTVRSFR